MGVGAGDAVGAAGGGRAGGEADGQAGGEAVDAGQDGEGAGELLAEARPRREEERLEGALAGHGGRGEGVAEALGLGEEAHQGGGLGRRRGGAGHDLVGQGDHGGGDGRRRGQGQVGGEVGGRRRGVEGGDGGFRRGGGGGGDPGGGLVGQLLGVGEGLDDADARLDLDGGGVAHGDGRGRHRQEGAAEVADGDVDVEGAGGGRLGQDRQRGRGQLRGAVRRVAGGRVGEPGGAVELRQRGHLPVGRGAGGGGEHDEVGAGGEDGPHVVDQVERAHAGQGRRAGGVPPAAAGTGLGPALGEGDGVEPQAGHGRAGRDGHHDGHGRHGQGGEGARVQRRSAAACGRAVGGGQEDEGAAQVEGGAGDAVDVGTEEGRVTEQAEGREEGHERPARNRVGGSPASSRGCGRRRRPGRPRWPGRGSRRRWPTPGWVGSG